MVAVVVVGWFVGWFVGLLPLIANWYLFPFRIYESNIYYSIERYTETHTFMYTPLRSIMKY